MRNPPTMGPRLYFPIYRRGSNRDRPSQLIPGHCTSRHILRRSPLPLCSLHRSCICNCRRLRTLIPLILGLHPPQYLNKNSLRGYIHWCELNLFPSTFPWTSRYAPSILRLPRRLYPLKHNLFYRIHSIPSSSNYIPVHYLRSFRRKTRSLIR